MSDIGLARGTVKLEPHNNRWDILFRTEAESLHQKIGIKPENIQHVGSTSIPGILAKPIIDIAIRVDDLEIAESWKKSLAEIGYWYKGPEPDMPDRRFFAKGPEEKRIIYLHVVNAKEFKKMITFRDTLSKNKELALKYSTLKQELARGNKNDRAKYTHLKNDFIQQVIKN